MLRPESDFACDIRRSMFQFMCGEVEQPFHDKDTVLASGAAIGRDKR